MTDDQTGVAIDYPDTWFVERGRGGWALFSYDPATVVGRGGAFPVGHGKVDVLIHSGDSPEDRVATISASVDSVLASEARTLDSGAIAYRLVVANGPSAWVPIYVVGLDGVVVEVQGYGDTSALEDIAESARLVQ